MTWIMEHASVDKFINLQGLFQNLQMGAIEKYHKTIEIGLYDGHY